MSMTISQLKQELINHGVPLPESSARKEAYERLYQERVVNQSKRGSAEPNDFSSEDDFEESETFNGDGDNSNGNPSEVELDAQIVAEIENMSNEEIYNALAELGQNFGPVVASTRQVFKKRLIKLWTQNPKSRKHAQGAENGLDFHGHEENGFEAQAVQHFSSDEEEMDTTNREPSVSKESAKPCKLTEEQKRKLNALLYPETVVGISKSYDVATTSDGRKKLKKSVPEPKETGFSIRTRVAALLLLLLAIYIAYEFYEEMSFGTSTDKEMKGV